MTVRVLLVSITLRQCADTPDIFKPKQQYLRINTYILTLTHRRKNKIKSTENFRLTAIETKHEKFQKNQPLSTLNLD